MATRLLSVFGNIAAGAPSARGGGLSLESLLFRREWPLRLSSAGGLPAGSLELYDMYRLAKNRRQDRRRYKENRKHPR